jgi:hypothetical protein
VVTGADAAAVDAAIGAWLAEQATARGSGGAQSAAVGESDPTNHHDRPAVRLPRPDPGHSRRRRYRDSSFGYSSKAATLGHYVRLGEETSARITAEHDTNNRRRNR